MALSCLFTLFTMSLPVVFTMCCIVSAIVGYYKGKERIGLYIYYKGRESKKEQELLTV